MNNTMEYQDVHENRQYKDALFRMDFKKKEDLLDLYNAVNGTDYQNPEDLEQYCRQWKIAFEMESWWIF